MRAIPQPREPHLRFDESSRQVTGCAGCNRVVGGYSIEGGRLMFGPLATTMMFCADTMDVEDRFLRTLADVRGFRVSGPRLELLGASGEPMAVFEAGEPPASA